MLNSNVTNYLTNFIGTWTSAGTNLVITEKGKLHYICFKGSSRKRINGTIKEFKENSFVVKVLWIFSFTFKIDEPPHKSGNKWKMRINGVELTKEL
jgi:hypothetical protein